MLVAGDAFAKTTAGLDLGFFRDSRDGSPFTVLAPVVHGTFGVSDRLAVRVVVPLTAVETPDDDGLILRLGNPYVGLRWSFRDGNYDFRLGTGLTFPTARLPSEDTEERSAEAAFDAASGSRGRYDLWLWEPEAMTLVGSGGLQANIGPLVGRADLAVGLLIPTGGANADFLFQFAVEGLVKVSDPWSFGAAVRNVWQANDESGDTAQVSVGPVIELDLEPWLLWTRLIFNIEGPAGTSFSDEGFWGWWTGVSVQFP